MLKLFVSTVELAIPLGLLVTVFLTNRSFIPIRRRRVDQISALVCAASTLTALIIAMLRLKTKHIQMPVINAWFGLAALVAELCFIIALWITSNNSPAASRGWRNTLITCVSLMALIPVSVYYAIPYFMKFDAIVPMNGTLYDTGTILNVIAVVGASALVCLMCWAFSCASQRCHWIVRGVISTLLILVYGINQWVNSYQVWAGLRLVRRNSDNFRTMLWLDRHQAWYISIILLLSFLPSLVAWIGRPRNLVENTLPSQVRLVKREGITRRRLMELGFTTGAVLVAATTWGKAIAEAAPKLSPLEPTKVVGDIVEVSKELVSDGHLHRFAYHAKSGAEVRFIVIKKNSVAFGTGLDACEICGPAGYVEEKDNVICVRCGVVMNIQTIGFKGGCNPIPIKHKVDKKTLQFDVAELEKHASIF